MTSTDCWADWIRTRRTGGDPAVEAQMVEELAGVRDRVLDNAGVEGGEILVDVGCGNGLIAFGALARGAGEVVFADISEPLLDDCRSLAEDAGVLDRCRFVTASADDLGSIPADSVDVVTTRSVLIYVEDKERAFREFHRILRPGGRMSLFEPINRFGMKARRCTLGYDLPEAGELLQRVVDRFAELQPETDPMVDFDERDLLGLAERTGFFPITLDYRAKIEPPEPRGWESFVRSSFNPKVPTLEEAMADTLTEDERDRLVAELLPAVEAGHGVWPMATAYLWAVKP